MLCRNIRNIAQTTTSLFNRIMTTQTKPANPLILILGSTGTGKSNLAIQLAHRLSQRFPSSAQHGFTGAEVINADAMQLYRGLPIITNKVTSAEQQGIPHHLLDHIQLEEEPWTVQKYVQEADRVIEEVRARNHIPIVVGGTSYYIQGLLFKDAILQTSDSQEQKSNTSESPAGNHKDPAETWPILAASTPEIYQKLQEVDPEMAARWHPRDRRKIQRSLEIYLTTGRKASNVYDDQKSNGAQSALRDPDPDQPNRSQASTSLRYDPIIFWLDAVDDVLKDRLNKRVDSMIENGLLDEAHDMHRFILEMENTSAPLDKTKGIWVSIGYKEMAPWINARENTSTSERELSVLKDACIDAVKAGTRQYAKRQNRYVRIRFANALSDAEETQKLFLLDCTHLEKWQSTVLDPAWKVLMSFFNTEQLPSPVDLSELARTTFASMWGTDSKPEQLARRCEVCDKVLMTEKQWENHCNSRGHKRALYSIRRRADESGRATTP